MDKNLVSFMALDGTLFHVKSFADDGEGILIHSYNDVFMFCIDLEDMNFGNFNVYPFTDEKGDDSHVIKFGCSMIKVDYDEASRLCDAVIDLIDSNSYEEEEAGERIRETYCNK